MLKVALIIWLILGTVLAGTAVLVILSDTSLMNQGMKLIPIAALGGFVLAMPLSYMVSRRLG